MSTVMHIKKRETFLVGNIVTKCGKTVPPGQLGRRSAPLCPACMRKAAWTKDRRR